MRTITTNGSDIYIIERPNGGLAVQQGRSRLLLTRIEAHKLARELMDEVGSDE